MLYALPDKFKEVVPRPTNIDSYATSYEVNGHMHLYQEPGEMMSSPLYQQISAEKRETDTPMVQFQPHLPRMGPQALGTGLQSSSSTLTSLSHNRCTTTSDLQAVQAPPPPRSHTLSKSSVPPGTQSPPSTDHSHHVHPLCLHTTLQHHG